MTTVLVATPSGGTTTHRLGDDGWTICGRRRAALTVLDEATDEPVSCETCAASLVSPGSVFLAPSYGRFRRSMAGGWGSLREQ